MKFEKYNPEEHEYYVKEQFAKTAHRPDQFKKYKEVVENAVVDFDQVFGLNPEFDVIIAKTDVEIAEDEFGRPSHYAYINGMGLTENSQYFERNLLVLRATEKVENWKPFLKSLVAHELAHLKFQHERGTGKSIAYHLLMEGHGMHSDRKVSEIKNYDWRDEWRLPNINVEKFLNELDKKRSWDQPQSDEISVLFDYGTEPWPQAEGYALAYLITEELMERKDLSVEDLIYIESDDWRKEIEKSVENLYGEE